MYSKGTYILNTILLLIFSSKFYYFKEFVSNQFNAEIWLQVVSGIFKAQVAPPKGQNVKEVCLMKPKKLTGFHLDDKITEAIQNAKDFATKYVNSYTK